MYGPRNADGNCSQNTSLGRDSIQILVEHNRVNVVYILIPFSPLGGACNSHFTCFLVSI
jgi:hypothetical protein